jgi:hypothetical protein
MRSTLWTHHDNRPIASSPTCFGDSGAAASARIPYCTPSFHPRLARPPGDPRGSQGIARYNLRTSSTYEPIQRKPWQAVETIILDWRKLPLLQNTPHSTLEMSFATPTTRSRTTFSMEQSQLRSCPRSPRRLKTDEDFSKSFATTATRLTVGLSAITNALDRTPLGSLYTFQEIGPTAKMANQTRTFQ